MWLCLFLMKKIHTKDTNCFLTNCTDLVKNNPMLHFVVRKLSSPPPAELFQNASLVGHKLPRCGALGL